MVTLFPYFVKVTLDESKDAEFNAQDVHINFEVFILTYYLYYLYKHKNTKELYFVRDNTHTVVALI